MKIYLYIHIKRKQIYEKKGWGFFKALFCFCFEVFDSQIREGLWSHYHGRVFRRRERSDKAKGKNPIDKAPSVA